MKYWKTFWFGDDSLDDYLLEKGEVVRALPPVFQNLYPDFHTVEISQEDYEKEKDYIEKMLRLPLIAETQEESTNGD